MVINNYFMVKRLIETMLLFYFCIRSGGPSLKLDLDETEEIMEKELLLQFDKELIVDKNNINLVICKNDDGKVFAALTYLYDNSIWMVDFDKQICKKSFRWMDEHQIARYYQDKLIDNQTILYGDAQKIVFKGHKKNRTFYAVA